MGSTDVILGLGSNVGDRVDHLSKALSFVIQDIGPLLKKSHIIESSPWGITDQATFLNQVVLVGSELGAFEILAAINRYQKAHRNVNYKKWGPRSIDIDILYFGSYCIFAENLEIPHPEICNRRFVVHSLAEIVPEFCHPIYGKSQQQLLDECNDPGKITQYLNAQI